MMFSNGSYNLNSFIPQDWRGWADYQNRLQRYDVFEGYYHNIAYHSFVTYSQALKVQERLYKHVRGVYNPINRLVEGYVSKVWGGVLDTQKGTSGAIPLDTDNAQLIEAITRLWRDSQWGQKKSLCVRYGAKLGDTVIQVVDDLRYQQVRIEAVDPAKVKTIDRNPDGSLSLVEFEYYIRQKDGSNALFCMSITPEKFSTRLGGQLTAMYTNGRGEQIPEWDNEYGFVPVVHIQHTDVGLGYGAPAAHGTLHKINELNDLASILNDGMRNQVHMPMITFGAKVDNVDFGTDKSGNANNTADDPKKDTVRALNFPVDARAEFPAPAISIADGLQNIIQIEMELERDLPELALHRLRESGNLTAPGIRSGYDDAIARYQEARGNYDTGLVAAHKMAVGIGGMRGYDGYRGFNLMSLENGSVDHQIKARPVISDSLSLAEKLDKTFMAMDKNAPETVYLEMGWSEQQSDEIIEATQKNAERFQMNSPFQTKNELSLPDDPDATPQDAFDARLNGALNEADLIEADKLLMSA
jgi:hypothetical protein